MTNTTPTPLFDGLDAPRRTGPRLAILAGYWSTNIGNAYFQLGAEWALKQAAPNAQVFLIGDQPGYWNVAKGNPRNAIDYVKHLEVDAVVVLGPYVRPEMTRITSEMLRAQHAKGAKIIVMAAGMMSYDKGTIGLSRRLMKECPPAIFTTRDRETYDALGDLGDESFDGVDVATFVSNLMPRVPTDLPPYMVLNFDQIPEPTIAPKPQWKGGRTDRSFDFEGNPWHLRQPKIRTELSYKSKAYLFAESMLPFTGRGPNELGGMKVLRTDHRYNPFLMSKCYRRPDTYVGDIPHSYLNLYANSRLTVSNRVHTCLATMVYGNPAMLFTRSPRAYLLKRLGADTVKERPTTIDTTWLDGQKRDLLVWMRDRLIGLFGADAVLGSSDQAAGATG